MGFYFELKPAPQHGLFREEAVPGFFWALLGFAGFALACMGGAAYALLWDLATAGSVIDQILVGTILAFIPLYFVIGFKLAFLRRYVEYQGEEIRVGFFMGKRRWFEKRVPRSEIKEILLINQRPSRNLAPREHSDKQYYIQGHWRLLLLKKNGKKVLLDRHTEKPALEPLQKAVCAWAGHNQ